MPVDLLVGAPLICLAGLKGNGAENGRLEAVNHLPLFWGSEVLLDWLAWSLVQVVQRTRLPSSDRNGPGASRCRPCRKSSCLPLPCLPATLSSNQFKMSRSRAPLRYYVLDQFCILFDQLRIVCHRSWMCHAAMLVVNWRPLGNSFLP